MATTAPIDPNARFQRQKDIAKQEQNAETQAAKDAMARRFAATGRLNSGAALKKETQINQLGGDALQRRLQGIQDSQDTEALRRQEIEEARKFQSSEREASQMFGRGEREASQGFASEQANIGRNFATAERKGSQDFSKEMNKDQQSFSREERQSGQQFQSWQNELSRSLQRLAMDTQVSQFNQQFSEDKRVTDFNMKMAEAEANKKDIFGRLGDFGTGMYKALMGGFGSIGQTLGV